MRWFIYNLIFSLAFIIALPRYLLRMRKRGGYSANFKQRFGRYAPDVEQRLRVGGSIWIHAVSVGEVYVAGQLMSALRQQSELRFTISTTTSTGRREAEKIASAVEAAGHEVKLLRLDSYPVRELANEKFLCLVIST